MKALRNLLWSATIALILCSCATPCNNAGLFMLYPLVVFDPDTYRGHDGSGFTHPIVLHGPKGEKGAADAENAYIMKKFNIDLENSGPAQREVRKIGESTFHVITFETKDGKGRTLYFDASETMR